MNTIPASTPFFGRNGGVIDHKYQIERPLGQGDYGIVFKVSRYGDPTPYALKVVRLWDAPPERARRVLNRFDIDYQSGEIVNEYLVRSHDRGIVNGNPYIVTDYCARGNINVSIGSPGFDIRSAAVQILQGLKALHSRNKVHGDLKPNNVLIGDTGRVVLCDFGIMGSCNRSLANRGLRNIDTDRFAAYRYMAPETLTGDSAMMAVLPTADIFAFGVTIYELLTGYLPFGHLDEPAEIGDYLERAFSGDWDRRKLVTPALQQWVPVIEGCLNPDPSRRLPSVDKVLELIDDDQHTSVIQPPVFAPQVTVEPVQPAQPAISDAFAAGPAETPRPAVSGSYCLTVVRGEQLGQVFDLDGIILRTGSGVVTVGRNDHEATNFISIRESANRYVSRRQCTLEYDADTTSWWLRDGQWDVKAPGHWRPSRNGTYIDSRRVDIIGTRIAEGDIITMGEVKLRLDRR